MEEHNIITSIPTQTLDHLENTHHELSLNNFTFDNFQETETFTTIETPSQISHHEDTRLLGDKNIFKENFWEMFVQQPLADFSLVFGDGTLMVNKAVLAVLSRNVSVILRPHHDCLQLADFSRQTFLGFLEILSQASDGSLERILPDDVAELMKCLDMTTMLNTNQYLEHSGCDNSNTDHQPRADFKPEMSARPSLPNTNAGEEEDIEDREDVEDGDDGEDDEREESVEYFDNCVEIRLSQLRSPPDLRREPSVCLSQPRPELSCSECGESGYTDLAQLTSHLRSCHSWSQPLLHCVFCHLPFIHKSKLSRHEAESCPNVANTCYLCGDSQVSRAALLSHLLTEHGEGVRRKCPHCEDEFLTLMPHFLTKWPHIQRCHTRKLQPRVSRPAGRPQGSKNGSGRGKTCEDCGGKVQDAWKHRRQCIAINNDIKYVCHGCKKGFRRFGAIKKHFQSLKKCKNNKMNQTEYAAVMKYMEKEVKGRTICHDCGCEYLTKKGIHEHRKNCSAFTQFKCFKCSRGINSMDGFHIHFSKFPECRDAPENVEILSEIVAKSQKPEFHVCYLCGAKYKTKESIEKHMMTHSDNLDYFYCPQPNCDKKLMTRKALNLHLKNHAMPKTVCSICGKQIKAGSMALHMVLHTGKKIECEVCGKLFQHKGVLNKHMKNAHDPKKIPKVPKEKKKKVKKEVVEQKKVETQLPPMQSIQVEIGDDGDNVRVSLPSVVGPGLSLSVPDINTVNMPANNYQNIILPSLNTSNIQTYLSSSPWSK